MKRIRILAPVLGLLTAAILLFACGKDDDDPGGGSNNPPPGSGNSVTISGSSFSPGTLTIQRGVTVTWTNTDSNPHTVTADNSNFNSGTLNPNATFSHTFNTAG
ncbi:MAG TPA: hypothetical protein VGE66_13945, partial [Chitinophagaceae bacterium]